MQEFCMTQRSGRREKEFIKELGCLEAHRSARFDKTFGKNLSFSFIMQWFGLFLSNI